MAHPDFTPFSDSKVVHPDFERFWDSKGAQLREYDPSSWDKDAYGREVDDKIFAFNTLDPIHRTYELGGPRDFWRPTTNLSDVDPLYYDRGEKEIVTHRPDYYRPLHSRRDPWDNTWEHYNQRGWNVDDRAFLMPETDIFEDGDNICIAVELPGLDKSRIRVDVKEDIAIITTKKPMEMEEWKGVYVQNERHFGNYCRRLKLPYPVDGSKVEYSLDNGVLLITAPKSSDKGNWITVTSCAKKLNPNGSMEATAKENETGTKESTNTEWTFVVPHKKH
jgi:HSP20 family molecular chaperone IbpA